MSSGSSIEYDTGVVFVFNESMIIFVVRKQSLFQVLNLRIDSKVKRKKLYSITSEMFIASSTPGNIAASFFVAEISEPPSKHWLDIGLIDLISQTHLLSIVYLFVQRGLFPANISLGKKKLCVSVETCELLFFFSLTLAEMR